MGIGHVLPVRPGDFEDAGAVRRLDGSGFELWFHAEKGLSWVDRGLPRHRWSVIPTAPWRIPANRFSAGLSRSKLETKALSVRSSTSSARWRRRAFCVS